MSLLERVLMKDVVTPVAPEEVRLMIQTCLENAALLNYTQLSQKANIEGKSVLPKCSICNKYWSESDLNTYLETRIQ